MMKQINRTTRICLIDANTNKHQFLLDLHDHFAQQVNECIQVLWKQNCVETRPSKQVTDQISTSSARFAQVIASQASSVVRSIRSKQTKAIRKQNKGISLKKYERECLNAQMPVFDGNCELDSRFVQIRPAESASHFDYWVRISLPKQKAIEFPIRLTGHMKNLMTRGFELKTNCLRLNRDGSFNLHFVKTEQLQEPITHLGVDIGIKSCISTSDGRQETTHACGHKIDQILDKLARQKKGSRNNRQTRQELIDQINYSCKRDIDWKSITDLYIEKLLDMRRGRNLGQKMSHWRYPIVLSKLKQLASEHGVRVHGVNPAYTSQTCSSCGHVDKHSRNGEAYSCVQCGMEMNADVNAAINILKRGIHSSSSRQKAIF